MALGASSMQIMRMILAGASKLLVSGILLGLGLTLAAERVIKTVLFGVSPLDGMTLAAAVSVLCAVSFLAAFLPARKATAIDPQAVIRTE
jgi:ABC-type antimicrobial peptide transport system permease subunit